MFSAMDNIHLGHLSRPQLVNLLLRIVDLLAQPLPQPGQTLPPVQATQAPPVLEPYDASIDPWNEPELSQPATAAGPEVRCPRTTCCTVYPAGLLNPGAAAFYPMVPGANCFQRAGGASEPSPEPAPGLPQFGSCPQADLVPFTLASPLGAHPHGAGGVPTNTYVPNNSTHNGALPDGQVVPPGRVGEVPLLRLCGCKCVYYNAGDTRSIGACYIRSLDGEGGRADT